METASFPVVCWLIAAQRRLIAGITGCKPNDQWQDEYHRLCQLLSETFPDAAAVIVRDRLHGYRNQGNCHVLVVEVFKKWCEPLPSSAEEGSAGTAVVLRCGRTDFCDPTLGRDTLTTAHIVKIGTPEKLAAELRSWEACRPIGMTHDCVLTSLRVGAPGIEPDAGPGTIVYEDANHVMGAGQIEPLEQAMIDCCRWGTPGVDSVRTVLKCLFERLGNDLYCRSYVLESESQGAGDSPGCEAAIGRQRLDEIKGQLREYVDAWNDEVAWTGNAQPDRLRMRREVLGFLAKEMDGIIDPVDYLRSVLDCPQYLPSLLCGCSHGDLHGRNVLVSIVGGDATMPALFDYEDMALDNLILWDFVKLETELKVRALPYVFPGREEDYIRHVYLLERHLAACTHAIHDQQPVPEEYVDHTCAKRLVEILLTIREEARSHAGVQRRRERQWLEEYYFLLAMYGISASRWPTYQRRNQIAAYISAGVSARLLTRPWNQLDAEVQDAQGLAEDKLAKQKPQLDAKLLERQKCEMSHHPRLQFARVWCQSGNKDFVEQAITLLEALKNDYPHVLQNDEELALQWLELRQWQQADKIHHEVKRRYHRLSEEMLCRFGRIWKDQGVQVAASDAASREYLPQALSWYKRAYEVRENYYPGINVATLTFVLGSYEQARILARKIMETMPGEPDASELLWIEATRAEAHLLLAACATDASLQTKLNARAEKHYRHAASRMPPRDRSTTRRQAELILKYAPDDMREHWTADLLDDVLPGNGRIE